MKSYLTQKSQKRVNLRDNFEIVVAFDFTTRIGLIKALDVFLDFIFRIDESHHYRSHSHARHKYSYV